MRSWRRQRQPRARVYAIREVESPPAHSAPKHVIPSGRLPGLNTDHHGARPKLRAGMSRRPSARGRKGPHRWEPREPQRRRHLPPVRRAEAQGGRVGGRAAPRELATPRFESDVDHAIDAACSENPQQVVDAAFLVADGVRRRWVGHDGVCGGERVLLSVQRGPAFWRRPTKPGARGAGTAQVCRANSASVPLTRVTAMCLEIGEHRRVPS